MERHQMTPAEYKARENKLEVGLTEPLAKISEMISNLSLNDEKVMDLDMLYALSTLASIVATTYFLEDAIRYINLSKAKEYIDEETRTDFLQDIQFFIYGDIKEALKENFDTITKYYEKNPIKPTSAI